MQILFTTTRTRRSAAIVLLLLAAVLHSLLSCREQGDSRPAAEPPAQIRTYSHPPLQVELRLSSTGITTAERLTLRLTATVPEDYGVEFPALAEQLGDFTIIEVHRSQPQLSGENLVATQVEITLEPFLAGTYTIPALPVNGRPKGDGTAAVLEVTTEELQVTVQSLLPPNETAAGAQLKDIGPPLPLERRLQDLAWVVALLAAVLAAGVAGYRWWRRRQARTDLGQLPPDPAEVAHRALELLLAADLLRKGEIKLFHVRISDILRRYIEERFGLRAPERTTEEFLGEFGASGGGAGMAPDAVLPVAHKRTLKDFLTQCDLVKFARHQPTESASMKTIDICRRFIEETTDPAQNHTVADDGAKRAKKTSASHS